MEKIVQRCCSVRIFSPDVAEFLAGIEGYVGLHVTICDDKETQETERVNADERVLLITEDILEGSRVARSDAELFRDAVLQATAEDLVNIVEDSHELYDWYGVSPEYGCLKAIRAYRVLAASGKAGQEELRDYISSALEECLLTPSETAVLFWMKRLIEAEDVQDINAALNGGFSFMQCAEAIVDARRRIPQERAAEQKQRLRK